MRSPCFLRNASIPAGAIVPRRFRRGHRRVGARPWSRDPPPLRCVRRDANTTILRSQGKTCPGCTKSFGSETLLAMIQWFSRSCAPIGSAMRHRRNGEISRIHRDFPPPCISARVVQRAFEIRTQIKPRPCLSKKLTEGARPFLLPSQVALPRDRHRPRSRSCQPRYRRRRRQPRRIETFPSDWIMAVNRLPLSLEIGKGEGDWSNGVLE